MKILLTSGGTKINIDSVRHIGNMSSGTFGSAICKELLLAGHEVAFLMADGSKTPFLMQISPNTPDSDIKSWREFCVNHVNLYSEHKYKTFDDYQASLVSLLESNRYDMVILAAAVSDFGVENPVNGKVRTRGDLQITLSPLPKMISQVKAIQPNTKLVGFKLLVNSSDQELVAEAQKSLKSNGCEFVVANDLRDIKNSNHRLLLVGHGGVQTISKPDIAKKLVTAIL
jgi:phosphopantothenate--cysteine ligase